MKKSFVLLSMLALVITMGMPQCAFAQKKENKVKKVEYLGHKYKGQVNKQKLPEGEGVMDFPAYRVFGTFNENNVTNAKVSFGDVDRKFHGNIVFDESDHFTLKAGGVVDCFYYIWDKLWVVDEGLVEDTLKQDISSDELMKEYETITLHKFLDIKPSERSHGIPDWLEPPHFFGDITVPFSMRTDGRDRLICGYIIDRDSLIKKRQDFRNYKDDEGRIWDFHFDENNTSERYYKVTYPDGSFLYESDRGVQWKKVSSDGHILTGNDEVASSDNGLSFEYLRLPFGRNPDPVSIYNIIYVDNNKINLDSLSEPEVEDIIKTTMNQHQLELAYNDRNIKSAKVRKLGQGEEVGTFRLVEVDGGKEYKYISKATILAEEAKKEAKKEAEKNKLIQSFTRRFGFNPMGKSWRQIIAPGRSFSLILEFNDAYINVFKPFEYGLAQNYHKGFELSIDQGSSKCYDIWDCLLNYDGSMYKKQHLGFLWVRGDKISSVSWY